MRLLDFSGALEAVAVAAVSVVVDNIVNLYEEFVCLDDAVGTRVGLACALHGCMKLPRSPHL